MRKAVLSALCSALVIPGLGQAVNQKVFKALTILAAVFVLFLAAIIKLYIIISAAFEGGGVARLKVQDFSSLWYLFGAFAVIWVYSVLDAFLEGKKIDRFDEEGRP